MLRQPGSVSPEAARGYAWPRGGKSSTPDLNVWTAVRRSPDGRHIRVLVAHDPASLRGKLETVEADEPGRDNPPGVAQPGGGWISGPCR